MWPLAILGLLGVGYILVKSQQTISAPQAGSHEELAANVLPANFEAWVRVASPRQVDAARAVTQFQLAHMNPVFPVGDEYTPIPSDGSNTYGFRLALACINWPPGATVGAEDMTRDEYVRTIANDPHLGEPQYSHMTLDASGRQVPYSAGSEYMRRVDTQYRDRFGLAPGAPA